MQKNVGENVESRRGKKPHFSREFVCPELRSDDTECRSSFNTKVELGKHIRTCHRFLLCGVCGKKCTIDSFRYSHVLRNNRNCSAKSPTACNSKGGLPANWTITADFLKKLRIRPANEAEGVDTASAAVSDNSQDIVDSDDNFASSDANSKFEHSDKDNSGSTESSFSVIQLAPRSEMRNQEDASSPAYITLPLIGGEEKSSDPNETDAFPPTPASLGEYILQTSPIVPFQPEENETFDKASSPNRQHVVESNLVTSVQRQKRSHHRESDLSNSPPQKLRVTDERGILKYCGSRLTKFRGTQSSQNFVMEQPQHGTIKMNQENVDNEIRTGHCSQQPGVTYVNSVAEKQNFWWHLILKAAFADSLMNVTLKVKGLIITEGPQIPLDITPGQYDVRVNSGLLQLWHLLDSSITTDKQTLVLPFVVADMEIFHQILQFIHSGIGFANCDKLLQFITGNPDDFTHAYLIGLLALSSVETMPTDEFLKLCSSMQAVNDPTLNKLLQWCCYWKLLRFNKNDEFTKQVSLDSFKSIDTSTTTTTHDVEAQIMDHLAVMEAGKKGKSHPRILQFECTSVQVSTVLQDFFLARLLRSFLEEGGSSVLFHVLKLNCDNYNKAGGVCFVINVLFGSKVLPRTFYVHLLVLTARIGEELSTCPHQMKLINDMLQGQSFNQSVVDLFWQFLHSQDREDGWDSSNDIKQLVNLSMIFQIPSIPWFLYGQEEPNTTHLMKKFMTIYDLADDNVGISNLTRRLLQQPELSVDIPRDLLVRVLMRDDLILEELSVYELVTKISLVGCREGQDSDEISSAVVQKFQGLRTVIRFGVISLQDFDLHVYDGPFLESSEAAIFRHNIYCVQKGKLGRRITISDEFHKFYQCRCSQKTL